MKRKHFITLLDNGKLSIYDAHCDPVTWVTVEEFRTNENLSKSQLRKLQLLLDGKEYEIVLITNEIHY